MDCRWLAARCDHAELQQRCTWHRAPEMHAGVSLRMFKQPLGAPATTPGRVRLHPATANWLLQFMQCCRSSRGALLPSASRRTRAGSWAASGFSMAAAGDPHTARAGAVPGVREGRGPPARPCMRSAASTTAAARKRARAPRDQIRTIYTGTVQYIRYYSGKPSETATVVKPRHGSRCRHGSPQAPAASGASQSSALTTCNSSWRAV